MMKSYILTLAALFFSQPVQAELDIKYLVDNGNPPWFTAARCLGSMLVQPATELNAEPEVLTNIIVNDPQFKKRLGNYPGAFLISPTELGKIIGPVEAAIYMGARDITGHVFKPEEYNTACKAFIAGSRLR